MTRLADSSTRLLIIAPIGRDAEGMQALLQQAGFQVQICQSPPQCAAEIRTGAGALVLTEESLELPHIADLLSALKDQPPWSELPIIILTTGGELRLHKVLNLIAEAAGSATLLERPIATHTLVRSVEVALRSRSRQYHIRSLLQEQERKQRELEAANAVANDSARQALERQQLFQAELEERKRAQAERDIVINELIESEGRFRAIADDSPIFIWMVDNGANVTYANRTLLQFIGQKFTPAFNRGTWEQYVHPEDVPRLYEAYNMVRAEKRTHSIECRFLSGDSGEYHWHLIWGVPRLVAGEMHGFMGIGINIHDRKLANEALRESEIRFRQLADSMPQIIWTARPDGAVDYFNERWYEFTGFPRNQSGDESWKPILHPEDLPVCLDRWYTSVHNGHPYQVEYRFLDRKNGTYRWFMGRALPVRDDQGQITKWFGSSIDIHELKQAQEALAHAQQELQLHSQLLEVTVEERTSKLKETIAELEALSYSISHDMRAPLRAMGGFAHALLEDYQKQLDPQGVSFLLRITQAAQRLDVLIQDIVRYTRVAKGELTLVPVDLEPLIRECVRHYVPAHESAVTIQPPFPTVLGHDAFISQILSNFLVNALKFVRQGEPPQVRIWSTSEGDHLKIWVEDNGIGIRPEHQTRLFQIFGRVYSEAEFPGTGIGLAIVKRAVERLGGNIGVESEYGRGSRFWFTLKKA